MSKARRCRCGERIPTAGTAGVCRACGRPVTRRPVGPALILVGLCVPPAAGGAGVGLHAGYPAPVPTDAPAGAPPPVARAPAANAPPVLPPRESDPSPVAPPAPVAVPPPQAPPVEGVVAPAPA